jgi:hypothetical protein
MLLDKYLHKIVAIVISTVIIAFSSGLKILNPSYYQWLTINDGRSEIAWEFYRNSKIIKFPIGDNFDYGMNTASTLIYSDLMPLYSVLLRPFSTILPERFQYIGFILFINFALNYLIAQKIFALYVKSQKLQILFAITVCISPLSLHRFLDFSHYSLTSNWIILLAIYLHLKKEVLFRKWVALILVTPLIHSYYLVTVIPIFLVSVFRSFVSKTESLRAIVKILLTFILLYFTLIAFGLNTKEIETDTKGDFGSFKSNIFSFFDVNNWSLLIPDISGPGMTEEGFSFIGISTMLILIFILTVFWKKRLLSSTVKILFIFQPLLWVGLVLHAYALTNNVSFGFLEFRLFEISPSLQKYFDVFRSTGRFSWLLGYLIIFCTLILLTKIVKSNKRIILIMVFLTLISIVDQRSMMIRDKSSRFDKSDFQFLSHSIWDSVSNCYKKISLYPTLPETDDWYKYAFYAQSHKMAINSVLLARADYGSALKMNNDTQFMFRSGNMHSDTIYVFSTKKYFSSQYINKELTSLLRTVPDNTYHGFIDGHYTFFPSLKNCPDSKSINASELSRGSAATISSSNKNFTFTAVSQSLELLFENWSEPEDWGTWSLTENSSLFLPNIEPIRSIEIVGKTFSSQGEVADKVRFKINGVYIGSCNFSTSFTTDCNIDLGSFQFPSRFLYLQIELEEVLSPLESNNGLDPRNLGIALKEINLS